MNIIELKNMVVRNKYDLTCLTEKELELYNRYYELLDHMGNRASGKVRHFKGQYYTVESLSCYTPTHTLLVNYIPEPSGYVSNSNPQYNKFSRPLEEFLSEVDHNKYPLERQKYRFEFVE